MFFLWISFLLWANPINFQQDIKPGLIKEISYFTARKTQIDELLTGKRRIEEAIPSLIQVPLLQKEALSIQKSKLLQMLKLIEKERMSFDVPSELDSKTEAQWIALQRSVWTAHEEALELELKVILKLEIFNEQYSDFKDIQKYRKHLGEQLAQLSNVVLTDKELKNQTKELLNDQERLNRFVWELHHYALGQDSIRSTIEEDLSFNLDERSLIQIETSTLLLITAQALGSSSEIEDKLDSIAQMVLLRRALT